MASSHVRLINSTRAPITLAYKAEEVSLGAFTSLVTIDGEYVPVERERKVRKVLGTVTVPPQRRDMPGTITITRAEFEKIDPASLKTFDRVINVADAKE